VRREGIGPDSRVVHWNGVGVEFMKDQGSVVLVISVLCVVMLACEKSTEPTASNVIAFQVPRCQQELRKSATTDSCFSYQFHDALVVDFCAMGNCCPDSNRFSFKHMISHDTIMVTIADTARPLCNCLCTYVLHMEFPDLPGDSYVFFCTREDYSDRLVFYSERVHRN
jgi:hypothetical protein